MKAIGGKVLIIGVGNTAMDCCRSSLRLGAKSVKVMARKPRQFFKASEWELEDAEEENVEIIVNRSPKQFVVEDGKLKGMLFDVMEYDLDAQGRITAERIERRGVLRCDDVILAIGQENAFPWIERDLGIEFDKWDVPVVDATTHESTRAGVFFGGDAAFGPKNIIWAVEHGHQAAISIHQHCQGLPAAERLAPGVNLQSRKMGMHEWSYSNEYSPVERRLMPHVSLKERFKKINIEVELGFTAEQAVEEVQRCLNCDIQTVFDAKLCIECDACIDICPTDCLTMTPNGEEADLRTRLKAPAKNVTQALYVSGPLKHTGRVMVKDEDVCVHCGLCAERCPTAAWDMQKSNDQVAARRRSAVRHRRGRTSREPEGPPTPAPRTAAQISGHRPSSHRGSMSPAASSVNDFVIKIATVNGTGSASANTLLMKSIFRSGIPVMGKNYFPSNIQGLPTWYEIRVSKDAYVARSGKVDLMVAMNAETYARDLRDVAPGGYLIFDSTWPRPALLRRDDITVIGVPLARMCNEAFKGVRTRILMKNICYAGALAALLELDLETIRALLAETYAKKPALVDSNMQAIQLGYDYAKQNFQCPLPLRVEKMDKTAGHILIDGNTAAGLGAVYAGATVARGTRSRPPPR